MGLRAPAGVLYGYAVHVPSICEHLCCPLFHGLSWPASSMDSHLDAVQWTLVLKSHLLPIAFRTTSVDDDDSLTHKLLTAQYRYVFVRPATSHGLPADPCVPYIVLAYIPLARV